MTNRGWFATGSALACCLALYWLVAAVRPPQLDGWRGFLDRDKVDALRWLNDHVTPGMTVASTNIEDSFLIDFYTQGSAFVPLYAITALSPSEQVRRYFYTIDQVAEGDVIYNRLPLVTTSSIATFHQALSRPMDAPYPYADYQSVAFFHVLLYYPYNAETKQLFKPTGELAERALGWFADLRDEARRRRYNPGYLIIRSDEHLRSIEAFTEVYRNPSYVIVQPKTLATQASDSPSLPANTRSSQEAVAALSDLRISGVSLSSEPEQETTPSRSLNC